ncbi:MAG: aspartate--tRNA ligase [candidate division Zixibacteria bacterium]|nr:aspartate--tRNA ligase [candidate division Zixibacteria bacterium]MDH3938655.1 aspartate--tRNA ligase [candidate division Zixibacteria bacterium]MDH4032831.1 aspartate--tRNA ligase [candidate division Zixibacteria bacterium]
MPPFSELKRTHSCGELGPADIDGEVRLNGWVNSYRNLGGLFFIDLRDRYGLTQVVINPETLDPDMLAEANLARHEYVVAVKGTVRARPEGTVNPKMPTGEIEVVVDSFHTLSESKTPPFEIADECSAHEQLRLEFRYLDLRRNPMQEMMRLRHQATLTVRNYLSGQGFYEIETPMLIRSTPEGARDYVVPSRVSKGHFYALPQSPQLLKQILMVSGFDKYFQLARCMRDEDLRSDRQPEHTQIDLEMSYVTPDDVFAAAEGMMADLFDKVLSAKVETPFPRYSFQEVMRRWGIDKPDLRFAMELVDLTDVVRDCSFKLFADNVAAGGAVMGIVLKEGGGYSRKQVDELTEQAKKFGAGGLAYILRTQDTDKSPIAKFLGDEKVAELTKAAGADKGDALFMISDAPMKTQEILGQLRLHLGQKHELASSNEWKFLWVTQFPLFEYNSERDALQAMHNIVSHPVEEDMSMIDEGYTTDLPLSDENHPWRRVRAQQYDLVLNGWEIASGGQRINRRDLQEKVLEILGIDNQRAERMFGFLLRALEYGAPPHAGLAPGLDRIVALMCGTRSIRDVIAFPKTTNAMSLMDGAPSEVDPEQLEELGLSLKNDDES